MMRSRFRHPGLFSITPKTKQIWQTHIGEYYHDSEELNKFAKCIHRDHMATFSVIFGENDICYDNRMILPDCSKHFYARVLEQPKFGSGNNVTLHHDFEYLVSSGHIDGKCFRNQLSKILKCGKLQSAKKITTSWPAYLEECLSECDTKKYATVKVTYSAWHDNTVQIYEKSNHVGNSSSSCKCIIINIRPICKPYSHNLCFKLTYEIKHMVPPGEMCVCCSLPYSSLRNLRCSSVNSIYVSPITKCVLLGLFTKTQKIIPQQVKLVQWFIRHDEKRLYYADFFENDLYIEPLESYSHGFQMAKMRHDTKGKTFKRKYYEPFLGKLKTPICGGGTFNQIKLQLLKAQSRITIAATHFNMDTKEISTGLAQVLKSFGIRRSPRLFTQSGGANDPINLSIKNIHVYNHTHFVLKEANSSEHDVCIKKVVLKYMNELDHFLSWTFKNFDMEILSKGIYSKSYWSSTTIAYKAARGNMMHHGIDSSSLAVTQLYKKYNGNHIQFSFGPIWKTNEFMSPFTEKLKTVAEIDISLAFASCGAEFGLPSGFGLIFNGNVHDNVLRLSGYQKFMYSEFLLTFYYIRQAQLDTKNIKLHAALHRYTSIGSLFVNKSALDLVLIVQRITPKHGILKKFEVIAYQFNHNFTHTCPNCPKLKYYIAGQSFEELKLKSDKVDLAHLEFLAEAYPGKFQFNIIRFCDEQEYSCPVSGQSFNRINELYKYTSDVELRKLIDSYPRKKEYKVDDIKKLVNKEDLITFFILEGYVSPKYTKLWNQMGYVHTRGEQNVAAHKTVGPTFFAGTYLKFLLEKLDFKICKIYHMLCYRNIDDFRAIFQKLVDLRMSTSISCPREANMWKQYVNFAIGVYNSCPTERNVCTIRLWTSGMCKPEKKCNSSTYSYEPINEHCFKQRRTFSNTKVRATYYPHSKFIHQNALLKVLTMVHFIEQNAYPRTYRFMKIHVDSITLGLSKENFEDIFPSTVNLGRLYRPKATPGFFRIDDILRGEYAIIFPGVRTSCVKEVDYEMDLSLYKNPYMQKISPTFYVPIGASIE